MISPPFCGLICFAWWICLLGAGPVPKPSGMPPGLSGPVRRLRERPRAFPMALVYAFEFVVQLLKGGHVLVVVHIAYHAVGGGQVDARDDGAGKQFVNLAARLW